MASRNRQKESISKSKKDDTDEKIHLGITRISNLSLETRNVSNFSQKNTRQLANFQSNRHSEMRM